MILDGFYQSKITQSNINALLVSRKDNPGSLWFKGCYPHVYQQLEEMTFGWMLLPKVILSNVNVFDTMLHDFQANFDTGFLPQHPVAVTDDEFRLRIEELLSYLYTEVRPKMNMLPQEPPSKLTPIEEDYYGDLDGLDGLDDIDDDYADDPDEFPDFMEDELNGPDDIDDDYAYDPDEFPFDMEDELDGFEEEEEEEDGYES